MFGGWVCESSASVIPAGSRVSSWVQDWGFTGAIYQLNGLEASTSITLWKNTLVYALTKCGFRFDGCLEVAWPAHSHPLENHWPDIVFAPHKAHCLSSANGNNLAYEKQLLISKSFPCTSELDRLVFQLKVSSFLLHCFRTHLLSKSEEFPPNFVNQTMFLLFSLA